MEKANVMNEQKQYPEMGFGAFSSLSILHFRKKNNYFLFKYIH